MREDLHILLDLGLLRQDLGLLFVSCRAWSDRWLTVVWALLLSQLLSRFPEGLLCLRTLIRQRREPIHGGDEYAQLLFRALQDFLCSRGVK